MLVCWSVLRTHDTCGLVFNLKSQKIPNFWLKIVDWIVQEFAMNNAILVGFYDGDPYISWLLLKSPTGFCYHPLSCIWVLRCLEKVNQNYSPKWWVFHGDVYHGIESTNRRCSFHTKNMQGSSGGVVTVLWTDAPPQKIRGTWTSFDKRQTIIFQTFIFGFHFNFQGCTVDATPPCWACIVNIPMIPVKCTGSRPQNILAMIWSWRYICHKTIIFWYLLVQFWEYLRQIANSICHGSKLGYNKLRCLFFEGN